MTQILIVLAVAAVASAAPQYTEQFTSAVNPEEPSAAPAAAAAVAAPAAVAVAYPRSDNNYQFSYSVSDPLTGDSKDQVESRDGPLVQGRYSLLEPDGLSRRVVEYSADDVHGFDAVVRNEVPVAAAVRADVAVPAVPAEPLPYPPAVSAEPVAVQHQVVAPEIRAEHVAIQHQVVGPAAVQTHHVAYTPATQISYQPVLRTTAYVPPPAVSSQTISHTTRTLHPQPVVYQNHLENVAVATPGLRAEHYIQTHVDPAITHQVTAAVAPANYAIAPVGLAYYQPAYPSPYPYK